jgi:hypothetical protein
LDLENKKIINMQNVFTIELLNGLKVINAKLKPEEISESKVEGERVLVTAHGISFYIDKADYNRIMRIDEK